MNNQVLFQLFKIGGVPQPQAEYKFHPKRKWKMDYAWPEYKLFVEIEGGIHTGGRHIRPRGFLNDAEKYNAAAIQGWRLLRYTPNQMLKAATIEQIKEALK